jgi:hypothetical protein
MNKARRLLDIKLTKRCYVQILLSSLVAGWLGNAPNSIADVPWRTSSESRREARARDAAAEEMSKQIDFHFLTDEPVYSDDGKLVGIKLFFGFSTPFTKLSVGTMSADVSGPKSCYGRNSSGAADIEKIGGPSLSPVSGNIISPERIVLYHRLPEHGELHLRPGTKYISELVLKPSSDYCRKSSAFAPDITPEVLYSTGELQEVQFEIDAHLESTVENIHRVVSKRLNFVTQGKYRLSELYRNNSCVPGFYCAHASLRGQSAPCPEPPKSTAP